MIYTTLTIKALKFACDAHKSATDRSGIPYIFHPYHLAEQLKDEIDVTVALLHDVVEDTPFTGDDLLREGFPKEVVESVLLLTREPGMPYPEYIQKLKSSGNRTAINVKIADLTHNSDLTRLPEITQEDIERQKKYQLALNVLQDE